MKRRLIVAFSVVIGIAVLSALAYSIVHFKVQADIARRQKAEQAHPISYKQADKEESCGNLICEEGEDFNTCPIDCGFLGWYSGCKASLWHLPEIKSGGIDVVLPYAHSEEYFEETLEAGLGVIPNIAGKDWDISDLESIRAQVQQYDSYPQVIGWYLMDEPIAWGISVDEMKLAYNAIKEISIKPVFVFGAPWEDYKESFDIGTTGCYPCREAYPGEFENASGFLKIPSRTQNLTDFSKQNSKAYSVFVAQGFGKGRYGHREPTYNEERYMVYTAYVHGMKSIFFWTLPFSTQVWRDTVLTPLVQNEIRPVVMPLLNEQALEDQVASSSDKIHYLFRKKEDKYYLIAVNDDKNTNTATFSLPTENYQAEAKVLFEDRDLTIDNNTFSDSFTKFQVHVYEIELAPTDKEVQLEPPSETEKLYQELIKTGSEEGRPSNLWWWLVLAVLLLAIAVGLILVRYGRKR